MKLTRLAALAVLLALTTIGQALAAPIYFNGFETDTSGWSSATRVASGTNGITSYAGNFHATYSSAGSGSFTTWGGYNYGAGNAVPTVFQEYTTSIAIYLDVGGPWTNDTRFDFSSAINNAAGTHRRDFVFNAGFYDDATGPGSGTDRFVISASNNTQPGSAFAKNPARDPVAISLTGWYIFEHHFYNNGGVLAVDMSIYDPSNSLVNTWTLSDPTDLIAGIGGNRYGWFDYNQFSVLAFDNSQLSLNAASAEVPEPASLAVWGLVSMAGAAYGWRKRRSLQADA